MPTYVRIGGHQGNVSGSTSKGYIIVRNQKRVIVKWGSIYSKVRRYYWAGYGLPVIKRRSFSTENKAKAYVKDKIRSRELEEYSKLPARVRILHFKYF